MFNKLINYINDRLVLVLASVLVLRVIYLFTNGLDLIGDESYYWDWSRKPDWCYYSKPPMVAWLIGIFTWLGGDHTAVVRLPAVLLGTVFLAYFYATTKAFYNPKAAAFALLMILATPFNVLANLLMTIDPPLYCFWMMTLYYLRKALFENSLPAWLWAGAASGAALLSKQAGILLPVMLVCFLLSHSDRRRLLKREFWLYLIPVLVCVIPILIWNQQHDWVLYSHSKSHFGGKETITLAGQLTGAGSFLLYQALLATPVLFVLIVVMAAQASLRFTQLSQEEQFLMLTGPVLLLGILALSLLQKVQGNWAIPCYFSALILLAGQWSSGRWQKPLQYSVLLGYAMVALTYALPAVIQIFSLHNTVVDPTYRFRHWRELATTINMERQKALPNDGQAFVLVLGHRSLTSQLAFYLPDHPQVFRYEKSGRIASQYEVWPGPVAYFGKNALIVAEQNEQKIARSLGAVFQSLVEVAVIANPTEKGSSFHLFVGQNLKSWPPKTNKD